MAKGEGRTTSPALHLICAVSRISENERELLIRHARAFLNENPQGRVISFVDECDQLEIRDGIAIEGWRSALNEEAFSRTWYSSYTHADRFVASLRGDLQQMLVPFYHSIADRAHQLEALDFLLNDRAQAKMLIFRSHKPEIFDSSSAEIIKIAAPGEAVRTFARRIGYVTQAATKRLRAQLFARRGLTENGVADGGSELPRYKADMLIAVQEGVAAINSPSALAVASQLESMGYRAVIVTPNRSIQVRASAAGLTVICSAGLSAGLLSPRWLRAALSCHSELRALSKVDSQSPFLRRLALSLQADFPLWFLWFATTNSLLDGYQANRGEFAAGLLVNEGTPVSGMALNWLSQRGLPVCGYWPALLGARADCNYFPAPLHLVYGEQLLQHILELGLDPESVLSVGSINYDECVGRDRARDLKLVQNQILPTWQGATRLVVVATEALPRPEEELQPVLEALAAMDNVTIVLKVHPADSADYFRRFLSRLDLSDRVTLIESCDLHALLHSADLLICVLSNIIVNAALMGTPTLVCDFSNKRKPLDFVESGLSLGCFSPKDLPALISSMLDPDGLRKQALRLLPTGIKRFNHPADGRSAYRVAMKLSALADGQQKGSIEP